ncbi:Phd finger protein [Nesidiocoris tenuis]|uniref:Phd finger protein n=1 Tax=Nesidiocoris tenuis TaxID=355587 RepID=A0ABN7AKT1_9HEMI|nr:Phd finger protein [Nesidiocoris tenuis]
MPKSSSCRMMQKLSAFPGKLLCAFCRRRDVNNNDLGFIAKLGQLCVHYFCLLMSDKLAQNGTDAQGILGFLLPDIKREISRCKNIKCIFCQKLGATISCRATKCKNRFHLPCGVKRGSLHQFHNTFDSFCPTHVPKQVNRPKPKNKDDTICPICLSSSTVARKRIDVFWPTCCKPPSSLIHRPCLQNMAANAGAYHFKCPLCNNITKFVAEAQRMGYYIPVQEPTWEADDSFRDQLDRTLVCERGVFCRCPLGPNHNDRETSWRLERCRLCGSNGVHFSCLTDSAPSDHPYFSWTCSVCSVPRAASPHNGSDEDVDIETIDELSPGGAIWNEYLLSQSPEAEPDVLQSLELNPQPVLLSDSDDSVVMTSVSYPASPDLRRRRQRRRLAAAMARTAKHWLPFVLVERIVIVGEENPITDDPPLENDHSTSNLSN